MIRALFYRREGNLIGFSVSGHAGYADSGQDIVCAAVTSAVEMTSNGITEIAREKATVNVNENEVQLKVEKSSAQNALLLQSMRLQLELLQEQFPKNIRIQDMEV
jgi:hypothetical protein